MAIGIGIAVFIIIVIVIAIFIIVIAIAIAIVIVTIIFLIAIVIVIVSPGCPRKLTVSRMAALAVQKDRLFGGWWPSLSKQPDSFTDGGPHCPRKLIVLRIAALAVQKILVSQIVVRRTASAQPWIRYYGFAWK